MTAPLRLTAFVTALVAVFGLAFGVGRITGDPAGPGDGVRDEMGDGHVRDVGSAGDGHVDDSSEEDG